MPTSYRSVLLAAAALVPLACLNPPAVYAQSAARSEIEIPAQDLGESLKALGVATHSNIIVDAAALGDLRAPALKGKFTVPEALSRLLQGSDLVFTRIGNAWIVRSASSAKDGDITVTGSRIRGAAPTSIVITTDRTSMQNAGQTSLGDVVRSIPQNSGGGQNPGVGLNVPSAAGIDVGGASTINLRGLGSDATLTLVNGHRLAYHASRQGIDVSEIPIGIVDRIEVVADGASAIYGSDAVAGVANVVLRGDFDGLETTADIGASTEGGNFRQQYGAVSGKRWSSGGVVVAYEYASNTDIMSDQRDYAKGRPGITLYPEQKRHAVALAGHQALTDNLTFEVDALFNRRSNFSIWPYNAAGDLSVSSFTKDTKTRSLTIAPSLKLDMADGWQAELSGTYGREHVTLTSDTFSGTTLTYSSPLCYCNEAQSVELAADGPLFSLPGGPARLAVGAGFRNNDFKMYYEVTPAGNVSASQQNYYAYGEVSLPVVGPDQQIPGVERLTLTGALRYERYPDVDTVVTPKLGLIWLPIGDISLKGSWGRSFKAATMYQRFAVTTVSLYDASYMGGTSGTALYVSGGNPDLKPERARTWSATLEYRPHQVPGLDLQVSYFSVIYKDRIVSPISYITQALTNPLYAQFVDTSPSSSAQEEAIAGAAAFYNNSSGSYDPSNVVAIVYNTYTNAGRQTIRGVDALVKYRTELGDAGSLSFDFNASYLESDQELTPGATVTQMAGTLFYPPHWRGRAGVTWSKGGATFNGTLSRIGSVEDERTSATTTVHGMTTFDLTARYAFQNEKGLLAGLSFSLTAQNLFNAEPETIATSSYSQTPYDTTNYSPVGRYLGFGISKSW